MPRKIWLGFILLFVTVLGVQTYAVNRRSSSPAAKLFSAKQVTLDVQNQLFAKSRVPRHIRVIHLARKSGKGLAFASFEVNGRPCFEGFVMVPSGYGSNSFQLKDTVSRPIQYGELGDGGIEYIFGRVFAPNVRSVLVIFSNGRTVSLATNNGYFWYGVDSSKAGRIKEIMAVTDSGNTIKNSSAKTS